MKGVIFCDKLYKFGRFSQPFRSLSNIIMKKNSTGYLRIPKEFMERTDWQLLSADNKKVEATMRHPGLEFRDYDKTGKPKLWEMMSLCSSSRVYMHHVAIDNIGSTFRDFKDLTKDHMTFLVTSQLTFSKALYNMSILNNPLLIKVQGGYIGNTSLNALTTVSLDGNSTELMSNINQVVYIDPETRKPTPLPSWWKEKYAESAKEKSSLIIEKFKRPLKTGHQRFQVTWTYTDGYEHANWTSYARYAIDSAHLCSKEGILKQFEENIENGVSKIELHYYGESLQGEYLDIYTWEDSEDSKKLYFDISKDEKSIFQCIMYFF
ncbi:uncharacterized protein LOC134721359 [Mytilus trossulus]|uniref:uncharacterized protein LOC134721359 n=1 Tax=Mytilus trossulus TaxID=6551 RepID=UPI003007F024